jgi:hypothetical protein
MSHPSQDVLRQLLATAPPPRTSGQEPTYRGPKRRISANLPEKLVDAFQDACARQGLSQRSALEELVRNYVLRTT